MENNLIKVVSPKQALQIVKENEFVTFFENPQEQQKFQSSVVLDLYKNGQVYADGGIDPLDVLICHYQAAQQGLSLLAGDYSVVKFGGKNPKPVIFTSYKKQREDVLKSENVSEFYPNIIWKGSKVQQRDLLQWDIENISHSSPKYDKNGNFDLLQILGFEFVLVRCDGKKFNYFATTEEILLEVGKKQELLFMYRGKNAENMYFKFVMRKLLKWLPFSLECAKNWAENMPQNEKSDESFDDVIDAEYVDDDINLDAVPDVFKGEQEQQPQEQQQDEGKKWLNEGTKEWDNVIQGIANGKVTSVADVRNFYKVSKEVAQKIEKYF